MWAVWGALFLAALTFVWKFGSNVPYWDEWEVVPGLTRDRPVDASWLWASHNGRRIPLPKLLLVAAYRFTGSDFRVGRYADVLALRGSCVHNDLGGQSSACVLSIIIVRLGVHLPFGVAVLAGSCLPMPSEHWRCCSSSSQLSAWL